MSNNFLYLPKVLFESKPQAISRLSGNAASGECMLYPFLDGTLIICAINGLESGFYRIFINMGEDKIELPSVLSAGGFAYGINYDGRFKPIDAKEKVLEIWGSGNEPFLTSSFTS